MIDIDKAIASAVKTGKVSFGANSALLNAKTGKAKMIVLASNCPKTIKDDIEYYGKISKVPVLTYKGASMDLANVCSKLFIISALSIREPGDSEILKAVEMQYYENEAQVGGTE
ncbi:MAG TPA: 50S ribosomal protein L30e [Candidatus Nanoarchaeia archaeon]|nr:50S ribosomal protein L30e [Candidatus Nanoarchaeia archaeon]